MGEGMTLVRIVSQLGKHGSQSRGISFGHNAPPAGGLDHPRDLARVGSDDRHPAPEGLH